MQKLREPRSHGGGGTGSFGVHLISVLSLSVLCPFAQYVRLFFGGECITNMVMHILSMSLTLLLFQSDLHVNVPVSYIIQLLLLKSTSMKAPSENLKSFMRVIFNKVMLVPSMNAFSYFRS